MSVSLDSASSHTVAPSRALAMIAAPFMLLHPAVLVAGAAALAYTQAPRLEPAMMALFAPPPPVVSEAPLPKIDPAPVASIEPAAPPETHTVKTVRIDPPAAPAPKPRKVHRAVERDDDAPPPVRRSDAPLAYAPVPVPIPIPLPFFGGRGRMFGGFGRHF